MCESAHLHSGCRTSASAPACQRNKVMGFNKSHDNKNVDLRLVTAIIDHKIRLKCHGGPTEFIIKNIYYGALQKKSQRWAFRAVRLPARSACCNGSSKVMKFRFRTRVRFLPSRTLSSLSHVVELCSATQRQHNINSSSSNTSSQ